MEQKFNKTNTYTKKYIETRKNNKTNWKSLYNVFLNRNIKLADFIPIN